MSMRWPRAALTLLFATLLLTGVIAKLIDSRNFADLLRAWHIVPAVAAPAVGVLLVLLEFQAGVGLLAGGRRRRWGAGALVGVYGFYVIAQAQGLLRGFHNNVDGLRALIFPMALTWGSLARDGVILGLAWMLRRVLERRSPDRGEIVPVRWAARR